MLCTLIFCTVATQVARKKIFYFPRSHFGSSQKKIYSLQQPCIDCEMPLSEGAHSHLPFPDFPWHHVLNIQAHTAFKKDQEIRRQKAEDGKMLTLDQLLTKSGIDTPPRNPKPVKNKGSTKSARRTW